MYLLLFHNIFGKLSCAFIAVCLCPHTRGNASHRPLICFAKKREEEKIYVIVHEIVIPHLFA